MWDDARLYQVAVDPFQQTSLSGKEDGRAAGLRDGYFEGVIIGRSKGWEVGLELGYIYDFSRGIKELEATKKSTSFQEALHDSPQIVMQSHRWERCMQLANDLSRLIDEFPDPDALLDGECIEENSGTAKMTEEGDECQGHRKQRTCNTKYALYSENCAENKDKIQEAKSLISQGNLKSIDSNSASVLDISAPLETIRARFKLLCILLKTKQPFDLKNILELGIVLGTGATQHLRRIKEKQDGTDLIDNLSTRGGMYNSSAAGDKSVLDSDW